MTTSSMKIFTPRLTSRFSLAAALLSSALLAPIGSTAHADSSQSVIRLSNTRVGEPYAKGVKGLTMFRGNPTRTWYGTGPLPEEKPAVLWRYPDKPMCSESTALGVTKTWCGSGWTGQPVVWERPDGITEVIVGTYDRSVHFINAETGKATRRPFPTGDIIKGSVALDPDGYPLLYFGSRDNRLRIVALDREEPTELWSLDAYSAPQRMWNDDWDGNPIVHDDYLLEGGENSWFYTFKLNRAYDSAGRVKVTPQKLVEMPGWTDELLKALPDKIVSIESSVALDGNKAYFTNSGGLVTGVDLTHVKANIAKVFFRFWTGDDVDATPVVDQDGMLYIAAELERHLPRAQEVGQLIKLNPNRPNDPIEWRVHVPGRAPRAVGGIWATPALDSERKALYVPTHVGDLLAIDTTSGRELWRRWIGNHEWSSPALIGNQLLVGLCDKNGLTAFDVSDRTNPRQMWTVKTGGCVESTPAVWKGRFFVGSRDGYIYGFGPH
jgi:outer membrane protein assembly factor BamB